MAIAACSGGCGWGAVDVRTYTLMPGTAATCRAFVDALPRVIDDAVIRDVSPDTGTTSAWGEPPIVLRCGVAPPKEYRPDSQLYEVDDVTWLPVEGSGGYFFTTIGRVANVEVAIPNEYAPEAQILTDLAEAIRENVPEATASAVRSDGRAPSATAG